jgi:hypothetical protein
MVAVFPGTVISLPRYIAKLDHKKMRKFDPVSRMSMCMSISYDLELDHITRTSYSSGKVVENHVQYTYK